MSTELTEVTQAVAEFDRVAAGLAELQSKYKGVIYDVATTKGMAEAKEARRAIREPRVEVEKIRKAAKAPILALGKKLDSEAARITKALEELECPIDDQIKEEEARKEAERQAKIDAEIKRMQALQERVSILRGNRTLSAHSGSVLISDHIQDLEEIVVDDTFQEFREQAEQAKADGLAWLQDLHTAALAYEAEQARIKAEREELARLREEQARRDAEDRARLAEEERLAREAREAEAAKERDRLRLEREEQERRAALERARIAEEERQAKIARDAEDARVRAEQEATSRRIAEEEKQARIARQAEEQRLAEERAEIERQRAALVATSTVTVVNFTERPSDAEMVAVLAAHYKALPGTVIEWLCEADFSEVNVEEIAA